MAEAVDAIIADLSVRYQQYVEGFDKATAAHDRFTKSVPKIGAMTGISASDAQQYADRHTKASNDIAGAEEAATVKITRTRKARADSATAADKAETASAKVAAKAKADVGISEAERELAAKTRMANIEAGLAEQAARRTSRSGPLRGTGLNDGPQTPLKSNAAAFINGGAATEEVAAEKEINHLLADQAVLQANLTAAKGADRAAIREQIAEIRLENQLRRAGLDDEAILLRIEERRAFVAAEAAAAQKKQTLNNATKFAEGAGIGRGGSGALLGGIAVAAAVGVGVEAIGQAVSYAKALKEQAEQIGLTTQALQVYQAAATRLGVSQEQLTSGLGQLSANLGRAQDGAQQQGKFFTALGIDIGNARDGFKTTAEVLPTLVDRLSSIANPAQRATIETALLGEQGRRLDGLLSGGTAALDNLADSMGKAGSVLSDHDIQTLNEAGNVLAKVKQELEVDIAHVVAGNAGAIESLARSFGNLVISIGNAIENIQRFNAQQIKDVQLRLSPILDDKGELPGPPSFIQQADKFITGGGPGLLTQLFSAPPGAKPTAAPKLGKPQSGKVNSGLLAKAFAPKPPKARKGKNPNTIANEADERTRRFNDQIARLNDERLKAVEEQTSDENERRQLQRDQIDRDKDRAIADLKLKAGEDIRKGADKRLTDARLAQAIAAEEAAAGEKVQVINLADTLSRIQREAANRNAILDLSEEMLSADETLAKTASERKDIELRLLAIARQRETDAANVVLSRAAEGDPSITKQDIAGANRTLKTQDQRFGAQVALIDRQNENPIQRYRRGLDDPQTAIQQAVADKLKSVDDAITDEAAKVLGVKDPFLKSLLQIFLQQNVLKPLYDAVQSASKGGGGGIGSIFGNILNAFGGGGGSASVGGVGIESSGFDLSSIAGSVPGFASGGGGTIGGNPGIDRNLLSINGRPVAKVGAGELLSISPNVAASNRAVQSPQPNVTVLQPIHADFTGARTDEQTMRQFQAYADARSKQAYDAAVATAGGQASGIIQRSSTLGT